ncbi:d2766e38-accb-4332-a7a8-95443c23be00-CDS [Sclerotinia trifoliorum]|uniref:D2766e38-accb-4332-a7a8-95443c23be00-CDS n=1 Tax=Sclerotinia trifoliorum TaxID=28548 RepID=A0A8H2W128_9HELO|nr:d2766e38-accb-4332-a7a8-95443c23be00-CDS [Sclerotinia trifoliorum]
MITYTLIRYSVTMVCDILMAWKIWVSFRGRDMQDVTIREDSITISIFSKNLDSSE